MPEKRINWTHDEVILVAAEVMTNGGRGFADTSETAKRLSHLLKLAPFHPIGDRGEKFRNPNGVGRKSYDIASRHPEYRGTPTNGSHIDREVLAAFLADPEGMSVRARAIEASILAAADGRPADSGDVYFEEDATSVEGRVIQAFQRRYERDPRLREVKLASVRVAGHPIACEACKFDFGEFYGEHGSGYIEVHHVIPLHATGVTTTRLEDLALLCSNCHRMIHRRQPWLNPAQLRWKIAHARKSRAGKSDQP